MNYIEALTIIHKEMRPNNYVEIGCRKGASLSLASCQSIAIDPDFEITAQLTAPTRIFKTTSDAFFEQQDIKKLLGEAIHLAFIDGMHQAAFALRDFMNLEKNSHKGTVVVIDDILPEQIEWASTVRNTREWTGDVYKIISILRQYRPDLRVYVLDIAMKGLGLITGLDPTSNILDANYAVIEQDIQSGKYEQVSTEALRSCLKPVPCEELSNILREIKNGKNTQQQPTREMPLPPIAKEAQDTPKQMYLNLLKASILNEVYLDNELRLLYLRWCMNGLKTFSNPEYHNIRYHLHEEYQKLQDHRFIGQFYDRKIGNAGFSHSMMGRKRLDNLHYCLRVIYQENISGNLIECGVWRGGGTIFMAGFARSSGWKDRKIFVADSFEGLPKPSWEQDANLDLSKDIFPELSIDIQTVKDNFKMYGLLNEQVIFLKGWFKDTLSDTRIDQLALLRLDGDLYESTMDTLLQLYDKVVSGGFIIVDDYGIPNCEKAVRSFFENRGESMPDIKKIDWTGVYWRKNT